MMAQLAKHGVGSTSADPYQFKCGPNKPGRGVKTGGGIDSGMEIQLAQVSSTSGKLLPTSNMRSGSWCYVLCVCVQPNISIHINPTNVTRKCALKVLACGIIIWCVLSLSSFVITWIIEISILILIKPLANFHYFSVLHICWNIAACTF